MTWSRGDRRHPRVVLTLFRVFLFHLTVKLHDRLSEIFSSDTNGKLMRPNTIKQLNNIM